MNFGITIAIALLVGLVVSGQTFFLFTVENLKQFGALKAIAVTNRRLIGMILLQALTVGFIGYAFGTGMAALFFDMDDGRIVKTEPRHRIEAPALESVLASA